VLLAPSGTIYVVGQSTPASDDRAAIWALTPAGAPETSFNGSGSRLLPTTGIGDNPIGDAALTPSGSIAVTVAANIGADAVAGLRVVTSSGSISVDTNNSYFATCEVNPSSIYVAATGDIYIGQTVGCDPIGVAVILKANASGAFSASFAVGGLAYFGIPGITGGTSRLFNVGGQLGAVGHIGYAPAVNVYSLTGEPSAGFGGYGGLRTLPFGSAYAVSLDGGAVASGNIVALGVIVGESTNRSFILRYNGNGTFDESFAPGGTAPSPIAKGTLNSFSLLPDGKYLLGSMSDEGRLQFARIWGDAPAPQPATIAFAASVKSKLKASKAKKFAGTTGGTGVTKVELAIQKVDSKLLKKSKKCSYVKGKSGKTKNFKAVSGKCAPGVWLTANGTASWSVKLSKALKPGKYVLSARSTGFLGFSTVITKSVTLTK
jgi:hypothetical protein